MTTLVDASRLKEPTPAFNTIAPGGFAFDGVEPILDPTRLPGRLSWTRESFADAWNIGLFGQTKVELLFGEVVKIMPMNPPHASVLSLVNGALLRIFGIEKLIRIQMPLLALDDSQPEPDAAVVEGEAQDFFDTHPHSAQLAVEVSDSTLAMDLGIKAVLYAKTGIPEYWVVDINARLVHVHRTPVALSAGPTSHTYQTITRLTEQDTVAPLAAPDKTIRVGDLFRNR